MGKETRIGVGVVGVLVVISGALLYGRLTRDTGLQIELNVDAGATSQVGQNEVPKQPTIASSPSTFRPTRPVSPAPFHPVADSEATGQSYLPDTNHSPVPDSLRELTIPDYSRAQGGGINSLVSPAISPAVSPATPATTATKSRDSRGSGSSLR